MRAAPTRLVLEQRIRTADVIALRSTLLALIDAGAPVLIDGSQVQEIDSASLQLLTSFWRSASPLKVECSWSEVSEPLRRAARLSGLSEALTLPAVAS